MGKLRYTRHVFAIFVLIAFPAFALSGCAEERAAVKLRFTGVSRGESSPLITAVVNTNPASCRLGLMYRKTMPENEGMLFPYGQEQPLSFWMKNTYIPLDIVFMDRGYRVVHIVRNTVPLSEVPRRSEKPAQFALEINGGLSEKWGIQIGSRAEVTGDVKPGC